MKKKDFYTAEKVFLYNAENSFLYSRKQFLYNTENSFGNKFLLLYKIVFFSFLFFGKDFRKTIFYQIDTKFDMYIKTIKNMQFNGQIFKICNNIYFIE